MSCVNPNGAPDDGRTSWLISRGCYCTKNEERQKPNEEKETSINSSVYSITRKACDYSDACIPDIIDQAQQTFVLAGVDGEVWGGGKAAAIVL